MIVAGIVLAIYVAYAYFGPDLAFALQQPSASASAGEIPVTPTELNLPYPRGRGQPAIGLVIPRMALNTWVQEATWTTTSQNGTL